MIAFGVLLILVAAGAVTVALMAPSAATSSIELSAGNLTLLVSPLAMFVGGAASVVLLVLGFGMVTRGTRKKARTHRELKDLRKDRAVPETTPAHGTAGTTDTTDTTGTTGATDESTPHRREEGPVHETKDSPGTSTDAPPRRAADTE